MEADPDLVFYLPTQVKGARKKIQDCFQRSHEALRVRENALLSQIDEMFKDFDNKLSDFIDTMASMDTDAIQSKSFSARGKAIDAVVRPKMDELRDTRCLIVFQWDDSFFDKIENLGSITHVNNKTNPDALAKVHQIVYKSKSPATGSSPQPNTPTTPHSPTHASFNTGSNQPNSDVSKGVIKTAKRSSLYKKH